MVPNLQTATPTFLPKEVPIQHREFIQNLHEVSKFTTARTQLILGTVPILFPAFLTLVIIRLSLDTHSSRSRIRILEKDETYRERLAHVVGQLEKRVEDAVADYIEDPGDALVASSTSPTEHAPLSAETLAESPENHDSPHSDSDSEPTPTNKAKRKCKTKTKTSLSPTEKNTSKHPTLTPLQIRIINSLNSLPNLQKHLAFIHPILNAHAVIIARDVARFPHHEQGRGVLRHMADGFVM